jgi:hypothetical protein
LIKYYFYSRLSVLTHFGVYAARDFLGPEKWHRAVRDKRHGAGDMGLETWDKRHGTGYMGQDTWDKRHGIRDMGQEKWDKRHGTRGMG